MIAIWSCFSYTDFSQNIQIKPPHIRCLENLNSDKTWPLRPFNFVPFFAKIEHCQLRKLNPDGFFWTTKNAEYVISNMNYKNYIMYRQPGLCLVKETPGKSWCMHDFSCLPVAPWHLRCTGRRECPSHWGGIPCWRAKCCSGGTWSSLCASADSQTSQISSCQDLKFISYKTNLKFETLAVPPELKLQQILQTDDCIRHSVMCNQLTGNRPNHAVGY